MSQLDLNTLEGTGAFVDTELVKESIIWHSTDGAEQKNVVYVKRASFATLINEFRPQSEDLDELEKHQEAVARRIAFFITNKKGDPVFSTPRDVLGTEKRGPINESLTTALLGAIAQANMLGKTQSSSRKKKSGMSSSSVVSAEEQSPKQSKELVTQSS